MNTLPSKEVTAEYRRSTNPWGGSAIESHPPLQTPASQARPALQPTAQVCPVVDVASVPPAPPPSVEVLPPGPEALPPVPPVPPPVSEALPPVSLVLPPVSEALPPLSALLPPASLVLPVPAVLPPEELPPADELLLEV